MNDGGGLARGIRGVVERNEYVAIKTRELAEQRERDRSTSGGS